VDVSFTRFEQDASLVALSPDLAVMLVGIAARQAASPTARMNARVAAEPSAASLLAPLDGAFNRAVAERLACVKLHEDDVYRGALAAVQVPVLPVVISQTARAAPRPDEVRND